MTEPVTKKMIVAGAYYDEAKRAIVLRGEIHGVKTEFQLPLTEDHFMFPDECNTPKKREHEMRKTAEMFDMRKGITVPVRFDGGMKNGSE